MEKISLYKEQLSRMRSMNRYYHDQFLLDVRILFIFNTIFIFLSFNNKNALYLIPLISLFGSVLLSFHAYFLIFSRHYSEFIEKKGALWFTLAGIFIVILAAVLYIIFVK